MIFYPLNQYISTTGSFVAEANCVLPTYPNLENEVRLVLAGEYFSSEPSHLLYPISSKVSIIHIVLLEMT